MRFTALVGARRAAVPSWHISSAGITIIPIIEMLDGVGRVGAITGGLDGQGNGSIIGYTAGGAAPYAALLFLPFLLLPPPPVVAGAAGA